jgi:putative transposase
MHRPQSIPHVLGALRHWPEHLAAALQAEVAAYLDAHAGEVDVNGHRLLVRYGFHAEREVTTAAGAVSVRPRGSTTSASMSRPALADAFRESSESWADLLRSCRRRGMRAPVLAVGDGALGFWKALRNCSPRPMSSGAGSTSSRMFLPPFRSRRIRAQKRRWRRSTTPKIATTLLPPPKRSKPTTAQVAQGHHQDHRPPRRAGRLRLPSRELGLRMTNPIESTFATVRLRTRVTKGPGSRAAGVAMAFKLIESAQTRWRAVNAPHLVALVRAGARFDKGKLVERPDESGGNQQAA